MGTHCSISKLLQGKAEYQDTVQRMNVKIHVVQNVNGIIYHTRSGWSLKLILLINAGVLRRGVADSFPHYFGSSHDYKF
jgi:hypothetical protein